MALPKNGDPLSAGRESFYFDLSSSSRAWQLTLAGPAGTANFETFDGPILRRIPILKRRLILRHSGISTKEEGIGGVVWWSDMGLQDSSPLRASQRAPGPTPQESNEHDLGTRALAGAGSYPAECERRAACRFLPRARGFAG
jgi:hypothetical protein